MASNQRARQHRSRKIVTGKAGSRIRPVVQDLKSWFNSIDWAQWWKEFDLSVDDKNRPIYKNVRGFVEEKAESQEQREFLFWYLGPPDDQNPKNQKYAHIAPASVGWMDKRSNGGWFHEKGKRALKAEVTKRITALDALRESGNRYCIHFLLRADELAQRIDEFFHGSPCIPGLSFDANLYRAQEYIKLQASLLRYYEKAQELYAKSHGIVFDDLAGLVKLMEAQAMSAAAADIKGEHKTPLQAAVQEFVQVAMAKASRYPNVAGLLPGDVVEAVATAAVEAEQEEKERKKVQ